MAEGERELVDPACFGYQGLFMGRGATRQQPAVQAECRFLVFQRVGGTSEAAQYEPECGRSVAFVGGQCGKTCAGYEPAQVFPPPPPPAPPICAICDEPILPGEPSRPLGEHRVHTDCAMVEGCGSVEEERGA